MRLALHFVTISWLNKVVHGDTFFLLKKHQIFYVLLFALRTRHDLFFVLFFKMLYDHRNLRFIMDRGREWVPIKSHSLRVPADYH